VTTDKPLRRKAISRRPKRVVPSEEHQREFFAALDRGETPEVENTYVPCKKDRTQYD
jgi:hypothetical protein